ncbi:MAG: hypothetical protein GX568_10905, partial [Candidatus Gastranaerophilales bacterium]|nr:hypothetical protein [Candidatus Gastranaerophilales bacterium]
ESYVAGVHLYNFENRYFIDLAKKWNNRDKNLRVTDKFYNFLKEEYQSRIRLIKEE